MKYKVAYRGDGTKETGKKIIAELEKLGGINSQYWDADSKHYYYVRLDNKIFLTDEISYLGDRAIISLAQSNLTQKLFRLL